MSDANQPPECHTVPRDVAARALVEAQCYCGRPRAPLAGLELLCAGCRKWYHSACVNIYTGSWLPFVTNYLFHCRNCSSTGVETLSKRQASIIQMCQAAIANLTVARLRQQQQKEAAASGGTGGGPPVAGQSDPSVGDLISDASCRPADVDPETAASTTIRGGLPSGLFSKNDHIVPFVDRNWDALAAAPRKSRTQWQDAVKRALHREAQLFSYRESLDDATNAYFGLVVDLVQLAPNVQQMLNDKAVSSKSQKSRKRTHGGGGASSGVGSGAGSDPLASDPAASLLMASMAATGALTGGSGGGGCSTRRSRHQQLSTVLGGPGAAAGGSNGSAGGDVVDNNRLMGNSPMEYPFNKDGCKYHLAEPDPHSPFRAAWDQSTATAGKPIPGCLYRPCLSYNTVLSLNDRAPQLLLHDDRLTIAGDRGGYCLIRSNHSVVAGAWYFELDVVSCPPFARHPSGGNGAKATPAVRVGWCQALANLQAPCGYDKFSYAYRSKKGTRFHQSHGKRYGEAFVTGDTIGCLICLPSLPDVPPDEKPSLAARLLPDNFKACPLVKFKGNLYFYEKEEELPVAEAALKPAVGSFIKFFKNGKDQGTAYCDVNSGYYHAAVSLYKQAVVRVNFGPNFKYPPQRLKAGGSGVEVGAGLCGDGVVPRPMSEAGSHLSTMQAVADILHHVENADNPPPELLL